MVHRSCKGNSNAGLARTGPQHSRVVVRSAAQLCAGQTDMRKQRMQRSSPGAPYPWNGILLVDFGQTPPMPTVLPLPCWAPLAGGTLSAGKGLRSRFGRGAARRCPTPRRGVPAANRPPRAHPERAHRRHTARLHPKSLLLPQVINRMNDARAAAGRDPETRQCICYTCGLTRPPRAGLSS